MNDLGQEDALLQVPLRKLTQLQPEKDSLAVVPIAVSAVGTMRIAANVA